MTRGLALFRSLRRRTALMVGIVALALAWGGSYLAIDNYYRQYLVADLRARSSATAVSFAGGLAAALNQRFSLVGGLRAFVSAAMASGDIDVAPQFPLFAAALRESVPGVLSLALAPEFRIRHIYPRGTNDRAVGLDFLNDPRPGMSAAVMRGIETRQVVVHDPVALLQGGVGIATRQVVFVGDRPWGAVAATFGLSEITASAGLDKLPEEYRFAVRSASGAAIIGDQTVFSADPLIERVAIPGGYWEFALAPRGGWSDEVGAEASYRLFRASFGMVGLGLAFFLVWLWERHIGLEDLVRRRTGQLANMRELAERRAVELASANSQLERMAYVATHHLQEPLRAVASYTQLLVHDLPDTSGEDGGSAKEYAVHVVDGVRRMKALLHDVQLFLGEAKLPLPSCPISANDVAAEVVRRLQPKIAESGAQVSVGPLPQVMADRPRLSEVLFALLDNAIKFRRPDAAPVVRVTGQAKGEYAVLTIADNGVGITYDARAKIFEAFETLGGSPGTGMGLAVARKMAERLGGRLLAGAASGGGAEFSVVLPLRRRRNDQPDADA